MKTDRRATGRLLTGTLGVGLALTFACQRTDPGPKPPSAPSPAVRLQPPTPALSASPTPTDVFVAAKRSAVTVMAMIRGGKWVSGTGFFVDGAGKLVTSSYLVKKAVRLEVVLSGDAKRYPAHTLELDEPHGLALVQADVSTPVPVAPMAASSALHMGDTVFALGSPAGPEFEASLSRGIVSSDAPREIEEVRLIQHDAALSGGSTGGPLLDQEGHVVGMNTRQIKDTERLSFAIPVEDVRSFVGKHR